MKTLTVNLPDNVDFDTLQLTRFLAGSLYEKGELTLGQAAEMAGVKKWEFPDVLAQLGIPYFNIAPDELEEDAQNLRQFLHDARRSR